MKNFVCPKKILAILAFGCHALFAQAVTFYFLPPDDDRWIAGNSYFYNGDTDTAEVMQIDATRCGWFKKEFRSASAVPEKAMIYLGSQGRDKLDMSGRGADLANPAWIPLKTRFGSSAALYLIADRLPADNAFSTIAPGSQGEEAANRCAYKMAAFIYDTDNSRNPSFNGRYTAPSSANNGIRRGIVAPNLDTTTRKPTFVATPGRAMWVDAASFDAAFTPKGIYNDKVSNIPRCYDMPFGRATNGTWEFDSDSSRAPGTGANRNRVGGFYPYILDPSYTGNDDDGSRADYTDCPSCRSEYTADCFNLLSATQLNNLPPVTYKGETYRGIPAFDRTYFPDGATHHTYYGQGQQRGCTAPSPGPTNTTKTTANLSFCFESHAEFVYEKGQEFFFRGDDDIWVFINNRLAIDLGGIHMAAPGYVDLDTIKTPEPLVEGRTYPIDIFFCERMGTQSNVRVSTNMYITQKSSFYNNPEKIDNWMCASIKEGNNCSSKMGMAGGSSQTNLCGNALIKKNDYTVDFYMVERSTGETISLSGTKNTEDCEGTATAFTCFKKNGAGGIKVDSAVYSCGGRSQCKGNAVAIEKVDVPSGNWTVYARLMNSSGKQVDGTKPLSIDQFKSTTNARIVWGTLESEDNSSSQKLNDTYGFRTRMEQSIIAGKRTPIYIAGGWWKDENYTTFIYKNDLDLEDPSDVMSYSLSGTVGLEVTVDSFGSEKATFPRTIPESGIDTLWVRGDFYMGEKEFNINLDGISNSEETPDLKLTVYQPKLLFTESDFETPVTPKGYKGWTGGDDPPYVGKALDVYVVAWDSLQDERCDHCNFILRETSTTNNDTINDMWKDAIIQSDAVRIENGKQTIDMRGRAAVEGKDSAEWRIYGPSEGSTFAEWTALQFIDAPVPMPLGSYVYDRNGDGIGDSLVIKFSKPFRNVKGEIVDSLLPVLLEVVWEKGNPVYFHAGNYSIENLKDIDYVYNNLYKESFFKENRKYWEDKLVGEDTIIIAADTTAFSKSILTFGKGSLSSYTPFYDQGKCGKTCNKDAFMYRKGGYEASVFDRISPIVVRAVYNMDKKTKNCGSQSTPCREVLEVTLSEPVFADTGVVENSLFKDPFSYCFEYSQHYTCSGGKAVQRNNQKWNNLTWKWEWVGKGADAAHTITYKPGNKAYPKMYYEGAANGDDFANVTYLAYSIGEDATHMPKATDWIKIRSDVDVFRDAEGNTANPREIGVLISGTNYYKKEQVKIAEIIADPDSAVLGGIFDLKKGIKHPWVSNEGKAYADGSLFQPGNATEFLPVLKGITDPDTIKKYYPASVGTLFEVAVDIDKAAQEIWTECEKKTCYIITKDGKEEKLTKENLAQGITLHANVFYHTNLGNYTAHRTPVEANCADKIFKKDSPTYPDRGNNCWSNEYNFYLAWDLKTNKNRFVGVGAYVAITKFYWQIEYKDDKNNRISRKSKQDEFIEMFGVRRGK
jgi:fibro-slime domain-containing protein